MKTINLFTINLLFLVSFINSELPSYYELQYETEECNNYNSHQIEEEKNSPIKLNITRDKAHKPYNDSFLYTFEATVVPNKKDVKDLDQYRFIKLLINNTEHNIPRKNKAIYASTESSFLNSENLYEDSEFKAFGKDNNLILTIPLTKIKEDKKLYIKIHGDKNGFEFYYGIEDGRKIEGIAIIENSCYDILLTKNEGENQNYYRFLYSVNKIDYPLITFTSTSSKNFTCFMSGKDRENLRDTFVNGYAFTFEYDRGFYEYHTFLLQTKETMTLHVCHRVIEKQKQNENNYKNISLGEKIYSTIKNFLDGEKDCYYIEKNGENEYTSYIMNYITKTKTLSITLNYENNTSEVYIFESNSGTLFLESNIQSFCFEQDDFYFVFFYGEVFSSIYFEILGVNGNRIDQGSKSPLINGFVMEQKLKGGQIFYYRLNETYEDVKYNKLYFQRLSGNVKVYEDWHDGNFQNYIIDTSNFTNLKQIEYFYENYIYHKEKINNSTDLNRNSNFSVYIVYCEEEDKDKICEYAIGISDEKTSLVLSPTRKVYSVISNEEENEIMNFTLYYYKFQIPEWDYPPFHLEMHSLVGNLSNISVQRYIDDQNKEIFNLTNYDNKSFYYINEADKEGFTYIYIGLSGKTNTLFYILYYLGNNETLVATSELNSYILLEKENHYNQMFKENFKEYFSYSFPDQNNYINYIVSISGINSYLYNSIDQNENQEKKYTQIKVNDFFSVYCINEVKVQNPCEFIVSSGKLDEQTHTLNKNIEFDGFYQYYILNNEIQIINLYYYFSDEELNSKSILVNVNKNNNDHLIVEYGFNSTENLNQTIIYKHQEIFIIDLSCLTINETISFDDKLNEVNFFIIRLSVKEKKEKDMEIKIKMNIKNNPTYLEPEKMELGYLKKNESLYYYFDYYEYTEEEELKFQEVYLNNKGNAKIQLAVIKGHYEGSLFSYNTYNIDFDDNNISYIDEDSGNNHFKIIFNNYANKSIQNSCKFYLKVSLEETDENNNANNNNLFTLYRHTQSEKNGLFVELNSNMNGFFYSYNKENYYFYTDIRNLNGDLIITLNCEICTLSIIDENNLNDDNNDFISSVIIHKTQLKGREYLKFKLAGEIGYYYFSISDSASDSLRYIEPLESELCYKSCKFILPLHNFYNYNINSTTNQTQIIFFVPDYEKINISYYMANMSEFENDDIEKLNKEIDKDDITTVTNNILVYDLNVSDIMQQEKYMFIEVKSETEINFNFIMSEFFSSRNLEDIKHLRNFVFMGKNETIRTNIISLQNEFLYKISFYLINGNGKISLDNSGNHDYYLSYESQTSISIFIKLLEFNISSINFDTQNDFIFLIEAIKVAESDRIEEKLDTQKTYRVEYFRDAIEDKYRIFPIKIMVSIKNKNNKILYVNYRFIELEIKEKRSDFYKINNEGFTFNLGMNKFTFQINETNYYPEYRRGYLFLEIPSGCDLDYITLQLNKNVTNSFIYEKVSLEITPIYLSKEEKNELDTIYIPKNAYIQLDINKTTNLVFSEPNHDYDIIKIEIANNTKINIKNKDEDFSCNNSAGKIICSPKKEKIKNSTEYIMKLEPSFGSIFVRFMTKKEDLTTFKIASYDFNSSGVEKSDVIYNYNIIHDNLKIIPKSNTTVFTKFKKTYFIRVFNYLDFFENDEINNILIKKNALISYRKELNKEQFENNFIYYELSFDNLIKRQYYINIICEVTFNESVEYFVFNSKTFRLSQEEKRGFEENWISPLVVVIVIFVASVGYIIFNLIRKRKQNKKNSNIKVLTSTDAEINKTEKEN